MSMHGSMKRLNDLKVLDVAQIGMMIAIIEVCKFALSGLPNVELTSFWLIMFTIFFGWKIVVVVPAFILIEGAIYGMNLWWFMYLYAWPLLVGITWLFRKVDSALFWAIVSGVFGLSFGALCAIPYFIIGKSTGGMSVGVQSAFAWWVTGIPWDFIHCVGNFILMLALYRPIKYAFQKIC